MRALVIAVATATTLVTPCKAMDSVCDKWEFADDGGVELKKCRAAEAEGEKFIGEWLARYGVRSPLQIEAAERDGKLFMLLYKDCVGPGVPDAFDAAYVASCLRDTEAREKAAGTDLTSSSGGK
jgi:hypothetical protein